MAVRSSSDATLVPAPVSKMTITSFHPSRVYTKIRAVRMLLLCSSCIMVGFGEGGCELFPHQGIHVLDLSGGKALGVEGFGMVHEDVAEPREGFVWAEAGHVGPDEGYEGEGGLACEAAWGVVFAFLGGARVEHVGG